MYVLSVISNIKDTSVHLHLSLQKLLFQTVILFETKKILPIVKRKAEKLANKAVQLTFLTMSLLL